MIAERRRPGARREDVRRRERPGAEPAELVACGAGEHLGPEEAARHAPGRCGTPPQRPDLEHLAGLERQDLDPRRRRAVDAHLGCGAHGGDMARAAAAQPCPASVSSSVPAPAALPTSRLANAKETGSAGPARGRPMAATPRRPPSCTTARSPGATTSKTGRAPAGGDHVGGSTTAGSRIAGTGHGEADPVARRQDGVGGPVGREERDAGAPDELPAAGRCRRVHGGVPVGQRHGARRAPRPRAGAPRDGTQRRGQPVEVGETGREPHDGDGQRPRREQRHHAPRVQPTRAATSAGRARRSVTGLSRAGPAARRPAAARRAGDSAGHALPRRLAPARGRRRARSASTATVA